MSRHRPRALLGSPVSAIVAGFARRTQIKSIQSGNIDLNGVSSATATITSVNTGHALIYYIGNNEAGSNQFQYAASALQLTNATTVTALRAQALASQHLAQYVVRERPPGLLRSIQRGSINVNGGTSATATVTAVDTTKVLLTMTGYTFDTASVMTGLQLPRLTQTNATTVTVNVAANPGATHNSYYQDEEEF